jgi:hypothetical protein
MVITDQTDCWCVLDDDNNVSQRQNLEKVWLNTMDNDTILMLEEYKALRAELLKCNENAQSILNWSFPIVITLFLGGLFTAPRLDYSFLIYAYYLILVPMCITSLGTVWLGEIVRQQRAEKYLYELETKINGSVPDSEHGGDQLFWHHWLRKNPEGPLEGYQFDHYKNIALSYLLFIFFSEIISIWIVFQIERDIIIQVIGVIVPLILIVIAVWWFNRQGTRYFRYGVFSSRQKK